MTIRNPAVRAIVKRDLRRWFGNPTGYVFITLFVGLASAALFWPDEFFQANLANLDTLNRWFPSLLLFFIPAVTMSVWAGERAQGTDELLLTMPATDLQIVLGKYLAAAGIYTIALLFTLPLVLFLGFLGDPDWGLLFSNYLGFWLLGLVLISAGMVGSQLWDNLTVAFILGALLCGLVVMSEPLLHAVVPGMATTWAGYGPIAQFHEFGRGVVSFSALLLLAGLIVTFLYLNLLLLSRRHWRKGEARGAHLGTRFVSLLFITVALTGVGAFKGFRLDTTVERVHSLSDETRRLIRDLPDDRTVFVQAFISPEVPREYVPTRRTLINLLKEYDSMGGDKIHVRIVDTQRYSEAATEAEKNFNITAESRMGEEEGKVRTFDIYMGVAFSCGLDEVVIPFVDKGLSVEYELTRSLRVVASAARRKVGVLDTDVKMFGSFDFQMMRQSPRWDIVRELELQYKVERVAPGEDYPEGLDVLVAAMPSTLTQEEIDRLAKYIKSGKPVLLIDDPYPVSAPGMAPSDPKGGQRNPMMQNQPPPERKGDIRSLLREIGIRWPFTEIVWQDYNPHKRFEFEETPEFVFVGAGSGSSAPFNQADPITAGLQEIITIFGGYVDAAGESKLQFIPLLRTSKESGTISEHELFRSDFFFGRQLNVNRPHRVDNREKVLACRVTGKLSDDVSGGINVIFVADLDMISGQFFEIRRRGVEEFSFDNVTFALNCVDDLAGDKSFVELRKRRPMHRTLKTIEAREKEFSRKWLEEKEKAELQASNDLQEARRRLDEKVKEIEQSTELDEQSKAIRIDSVRKVEQRQLDLREASIEDAKSRAIELAMADKLHKEGRIRDFYRAGTLVISPIPAVLVGVWTFLRRRKRERVTAGPRGGAS
ncbi:MAG: Gldg family protein [Planctomycetota bacterium]